MAAPIPSSLDRVDDASSAKYPIIAFFWLALMGLAYATNSADRQLFPTLLPSIRTEFGWALRDAGLLSTGFTLGLAIVGIPAGIIVDRISRKLVIVVSMVIYSVFTLATIYATGFWDMFVYRVLTGVGEGMQMAAAFSIIGSYFYQRRTFFLGWMTMAYGIGSFFGPRLAVWLHVSADNWRLPFIYFTWAGIILAVTVLFVLPSKFTESRVAKTTSAHDEAAVANIPPSLWNRNVLIGLVGSAINGLAVFGFLSLYAVFLTEALKFSGPNMGAALSYFGLGGFLSFLGGYLGDRVQNRWVAAGAFIGMGISGYLVYNVAMSLPAQSALCFAIGAFSSAFVFVNMLSLLQKSVRPNMVGKASGIFLTAMYGAGAAAGYLMGWLVQVTGWSNAGLIQIALLPAIGAIAMAFVDQSKLLATRKACSS